MATETAGRVCVTGAGGQAGRAVVRELLEHGYQVMATDLVATRDQLEAGMLRADLTDYGQALQALEGAEAVVHLANIPAPGLSTPAVTFSANVAMNFNVFYAAAKLGLRRVVWASSETTLGLPFDIPPDYAPVDEQHVRPESSYALSKVLGEEMARQFSRWAGMTIIGLRLSNVLVRDDYRHFPEYWDDPHARKWNLWSYVDESHVALAVRCALEADVQGADSFIIAAADSVMYRPSRELMAEVFPEVPVADDVPEHGTLLGIDKARRVLGYDPQWTWRELF